MRVVLRADALHDQGAGHVMRVATLGSTLRRRGHDVIFMGCIDNIPWLEARIAQLGFTRQPVAANELPTAEVAALADLVVVDSYQIDPSAVSRLAAVVPLVAIIDGDDRGMAASLYVDHNLGADGQRQGPRRLMGAKYALVREDVIAAREVAGARTGVVAVLGGTDPQGIVDEVAVALNPLASDVTPVTIVTARELGAARPFVTVARPTDDLPRLLAGAQVVVTAGGTTVWDVATLGIPSIVIATVDNQLTALREAVAHGISDGLDWVGSERDPEELRNLTASLLGDRERRDRMSATARKLFDGRGSARVAQAIEQLVEGNG